MKFCGMIPCMAGVRIILELFKFAIHTFEGPLTPGGWYNVVPLSPDFDYST